MTVAVPEEAVHLLRDAAAALAQRQVEVGGRCVDYRVDAAAPNEVARSLDAGSARGSDLWMPDSSVWLERIDGFAGEPVAVADSVARSPVVVAGRGIRQPASWREILSRGDVSFVDPLRSSAPVAALLALKAETSEAQASEKSTESVMVPLAQRVGGDRHAPRDLSDLVLNAGGAAVLTEQQLLDQRARGLGRDLDATVPKTGTLVLDYPLVALTQDQAKLEAAKLLTSFLRSGRGTELLHVAGFRSPDLRPLPYDRGAGRVHVLPTPRADVVASMLRRWSVLTVPSRILAVFDVSGSMDQAVDGRTRVSVATQASAGALGIFPDQSRVGMWAFNIGLGGGKDYRELVGIRRLDARVDGTSQRRLLGRALAELPSLTVGGTGLYDTTLAAVRALRSDYDDEAINTVVLLTDGRNEDQHSIALPDLLHTLRRERDPARPVSVIAIGVGPDADANALHRIVDATGGGRSYVARDPDELGKVFHEALLSR